MIVFYILKSMAEEHSLTVGMVANAKYKNWISDKQAKELLSIIG